MNKNFTKQDIEQFFYDTVCKCSDIQVKELKKLADSETFLGSVAGYDSLDVIELVTEIENKFGQRISDADVVKMEKMSANQILEDLYMRFASDLTKKNLKAVTVNPFSGMRVKKDGVPFCKLTEQPCTKIIDTAVRTKSTACDVAKCVLYKNFVKYR